MMSVMFSIIVFIAFKLVPPGADEFQVATASGEGEAVGGVMEFSRQPDGEWLMTDPSGKPSLRYAFDGRALTLLLSPEDRMEGAPEGLTLKGTDLFLNADSIDWKRAEEITTRDGARAFLFHRRGEVKVELVTDRGDGTAAQIYYVRWKAGQPE